MIKSWEKWVKLDSFEIQIERKTKDDHKVVLVRKYPDDKVVWGFLYLGEDEDFEITAPQWDFNGEMIIGRWGSNMDIDPLTDEELNKLP